MMKKLIYLLFIINGFSYYALAQENISGAQSHFFTKDWTFSVFNNAIALPLSGKAGIVHTPVHFGATVGKIHAWNNNPHHQIYQTFTTGIFYQQYVQTGLQVYSAFNYRYQTGFNLGFEAHLGAGYIHAFRDLQQFKLNENGEYEKKKNWGRPGLMIPAEIAFSYKINEYWRPFIGYQMWFQTPFSKEYIPVLPNTSLHLGTTFSLKN
jgi:hypothetical protein